MYYNSIVETIGNTPMVKLNRIFSGIQGTVLAKVEYFNPGISTKDRMAFKMIEDAEKDIDQGGIEQHDRERQENHGSPRGVVVRRGRARV